MSETPHAAIQAAADWWANQLTGTPTQDNGDAMNNAFMATLQLMPDQPNRTPEQIDAFRDHLVAVLERDNNWRRGVHNDYNAGLPLQEAGALAGIRVGMLTFPCKTNMWIDADSVRVSAGYGSSIEIVWAAESKAEAA